MRSRWSDAEAARCVERWSARWGEALALRTYTSRLLGAEPDLVLHGGGNTSLKGTVRDLFGDEAPALFVKASGGDLASIEPEGHVAVRLDPDRGTARLDDSIIDACFYGDCAARDIAFARARLCDDPLAPLTTPLALGDAAALELPRVYIECLRDATLTLERQRAIQLGSRWERVYSLDTGHSPFFSAPGSSAVTAAMTGAIPLFGLSTLSRVMTSGRAGTTVRTRIWPPLVSRRARFDPRTFASPM